MYCGMHGGSVIQHLQEQLAERDAQIVPSFLFTLGCYCFRIRGSGLFIGP